MPRVKVIKINETLKQIDQMEFNEEMYESRDVARKLWQKFVYATSRIQDFVEREFKSISKVITPSDNYRKYERERSELAMKYANTDKDGNPVILGKEYVIKKDRDIFDKEIAKLKKKYKDAVDERKKQVESIEDFLEEETEFESYGIKFEYLPMTLNKNQMNSLMEFITEDEEEINKKMV